MPAYSAGPWLRKGRGWYTTVHGKQVRVAGPDATRQEAFAAWRLLEAAPPPPGAAPAGPLLLSEVIADYLADLAARRDRGEVAAASFDESFRRFRSAATDLGPTPMADLRPYHVTEWLNRPEFAGLSAASRRDTMVMLRRACKWAFEQGKVPAHPLVGLKLPPATKHRKVDVRPEVWAKLFAEIRSPRFRDFVRFLYLTGARAGEAARLTAAHLRADHAELDSGEHKTGRRTGRGKVIELVPEARAILERLAKERPRGPLFVNDLGRPWVRDSWRQAFARAKARAGLADVPMTLHGTRHLFITDARAAGVPDETTAQLVGHASTRMINDVYGHLSQRRAYLRKTLGSFRDAGGEPPKPEG